MINVIHKNSTKDFLKEFGIFINETSQGVSVIDSYPAFPTRKKGITITEVNNKDPKKKDSWLVGENLAKYLNGDLAYIYLEDYSWDGIFYDPINLQNGIVLQCCHFTELSLLEYISLDHNYLVLDLRINFGSSIREMKTYFDEFQNKVTSNVIKKIYLLVSNSTCSSAELFVDKLSRYDGVTVVGSDTYKKKYAYSVIEEEDKLIYIPKYEIKTEFNINTYVGFNYYYKVRTFNRKKIYQEPQIWCLKGGE